MRISGMKFVANEVNAGKEILANNDYAAMPYTFERDAKAGDIIDGYGVCLYDVKSGVNPNGAVVYRGVINASKLEENQFPTTAQMAKLPQLIWVFDDGERYNGNN